MSFRTARPPLAAALALLAACGGDQLPTDTSPIEFAKGGNAAPLTATPGSLALVIPSATTGSVTASVQFTGVIIASTSDPSCATVGPLNVPATKPPGSSLYVATFTVTAAAPGSCTITLTDKRGGTATVQVQVREAPPVDGTKLVFRSDRDGNSELYSSNGDGSGLVRLTTTAYTEDEPAFFPDRSKLVYASLETGTWNLFMANADGTGREQLTFYALGSGFGAVSPAVSPDGQQIAFVLFDGFGGTAGTHIHVMAAVAGAAPVALTAGNTDNGGPTYAPDGRILFASVPFDPGPPKLSDIPSIWIMAGNGANLTRLTNSGIPDRDPTVSPDGTTVAFTRFGAIALMDIDGQNQRVVVTSTTNASPVFSPDGGWLAFTSYASGSFGSDLMVLKLGRPEAEAANVTSSSGFDTGPDWR